MMTLLQDLNFWYCSERVCQMIGAQKYLLVSVLFIRVLHPSLIVATWELKDKY